MSLCGATFLIAIIISVILTPGVIRLAAATGAMDKPDPRKVHKKPIPRIGGIGIYVAFMAAVIFMAIFTDLQGESLKEIIGLIVSGSFIVFVGIVDDYKNLPAKVKLLGQIIAAVILVLIFEVRIDFISDPFGDYIYLENFFAIPVTIFWLVGLTNTVNLIDGLDGLAAGVIITEIIIAIRKVSPHKDIL